MNCNFRFGSLVTISLFAAVLSAFLNVAVPVMATPVVTSVTSGSQLSTPTTNDLILSSSPTLSSSMLILGTVEYGNFSGLNDGVFADATTGGNLGLSAVLTQGSEVAYLLDNTIHPQGYTLTSFVSTSAWPDGRVGQEYSLYYTTVAAPATPIFLTTVDKPQVGGSQQVTITDTTGVLASNVFAVGILINNNAGGNGNLDTVYQEFVANGTPAPEPSSIVLALCALGGCVALGRAKK